MPAAALIAEPATHRFARRDGRRVGHRDSRNGRVHSLDEIRSYVIHRSGRGFVAARRALQNATSHLATTNRWHLRCTVRAHAASGDCAGRRRVIHASVGEETLLRTYNGRLKPSCALLVIVALVTGLIVPPGATAYLTDTASHPPPSSGTYAYD